jgi:hypothetical protein
VYFAGIAPPVVKAGELTLSDFVIVAPGPASGAGVTACVVVGCALATGGALGSLAGADAGEDGAVLSRASGRGSVREQLATSATTNQTRALAAM